MARGETIEVVIKVKDDASAGLKGIRAQTAGLSDDLLDVDGSAEEAAGSFDLMAFASSPAAAGVLAIGTAAVGAAAGIFKLAQGASDWVDSIKRAANETQLADKTVVAFESALGAAGLELGEGVEAVKGLGAVLKEAVLNGGDAEKKFTDLGIAIRDEVTGQTRDVDAVFRDAIDTIRLIPNAADRGVASMNLFGESGTRLTPIIEGGTASLDAWGASAEAAGKVINEETLQASADFDAAMVDINNTIEGLVVTVGTDLVPIIATLAEAFVTIAGPLATAWEWMKRIAEMTNVVGIGFEALSGDFEAIGQRFTGAPDVAGGGGGQSQAESDRISASVEAGFLGVDGLTDAERKKQQAAEVAQREQRRADFKKAAEDQVKDRASASSKAAAAPVVDPFAGQNAFNALVESLFGEQVRAEAEAFMAIQAKGAENFAAFNALVEEGANAQQLALAAEEQAAKDLAATNFALFNQMVEDGAEAQLRLAEAADLAASTVAAPSGKTGNEKAAGVAGALGAVQGGLTGILSALGPAGAVASGIVGVASNLPAIIDGILDSLDDILVGLVEGIPKIIFELIPALVKAGLKDIPNAIADALLGVFEKAFPGIKGAKERAGAVTDEFTALENRLFAGISGGLIGGKNQGFASGGFVSQSGMAMVHRGEFIETQNGVTSSGNERRRQDGGGGGGGGSPTVIVNLTGFMDASSLDRFVEQLNRAIGPRGFGVASVN